MRLNTISIRRRMVFIAAVFAAAVLFVGMMSLFQSSLLNSGLKRMFTVTLPAVDLIIEADRDLQQLLVAERSMMITDPSSEQFKKFREEYQSNFEQSDTRIGDYRKLAESPEEKALLEQYDAARNEWKVQSSAVIAALEQGGGDLQNAETLSMGLSKEKFEVMRDYLDKLTELSLAKAEELKKRSENRFWMIVLSTLLSIIGIVGAGLYLALKISKSITEPITKLITIGEKIAVGDLPEELAKVEGSDEIARLTEMFNSITANLKEKAEELKVIASGDLTPKVKYLSENDQFAQVFERMLHSLNSSLLQVKTATEQVHLGSNQISQTSQGLAEGASLQAAALEEISSSLTEISGQAAENTRNSETARAKAEDSRKTATDGNDLIVQVVSAMEQIKNSAGSIKGIVKTIDDIAFQTNLLALNAAVEAARAGQHGKGFAVVADEVRNLAQRSASSAQTTTEKVEEAIAGIEQGYKLVKQTAEQFSVILSDTDGIAAIVADIARSSRDQANRLDGAKTSLSQVDVVTQNNAASSEENASTSQELMSQAEVLSSMVKNFKLAGDVPSVNPVRQRTERITSGRTIELPQPKRSSNVNSQPKLISRKSESESVHRISDSDYGGY